MKSATSQIHSRWLIAAFVALLLGAQVAQSAHVHLHQHFAPDCAQCSLDGGQASGLSTLTPLCLPAATPLHLDILDAPIVAFYRLAARGPPALSS